MNADQYHAFDRIAKWLEAGAPHEDARGMKFNMQDLLVLNTDTKGENWCGTSCCIAGAAVAFEAPELVATAEWKLSRFDHTTSVISQIDPDTNTYMVWEKAKRILGLNEPQAEFLFVPWECDWGDDESPDKWPWSADEIDAAWAARTIRHYLATGEIRWDKTKEAA